jgi:acyl dehydratase
VNQKALYLEDISVGDEFVSIEHRLDAEQIIDFASQFDPQPFHLDAEAAELSFFRGLAASGWHTMAISMKLLVQSVPFANGVIGAGGEISWPRPTRPDDTLHVKSTVIEIMPSRSKPNQAIVVLNCLTLNQNDEVRQDLTAKLLVFKKER